MHWWHPVQKQTAEFTKWHILLNKACCAYRYQLLIAISRMPTHWPPLVSRVRLDQILTEFWSKIAISKRKMRRGREKDGYYVGCYPGQNAFKKLVIWPKNGDHPLVSRPKSSRGVNELVFYWLLWSKERVSLLESRQSLLRSNNFFWWYCELVIELTDWIIIFMSTMVRDEHRNWFVGISILLT